MSGNFSVTPESTYEAESEQPDRRRTVLIWLIFAYGCLSLMSGFIVFGMYFGGWQPQSGKELTHFLIYYPDGVHIILEFALCLFIFVAGLALFNLRARSVMLFSFAFGTIVLRTFYGLVKVPYPETELSTDFWQGYLLTFGVELIITALILGYTVRLRRRGVLK